MTTESYIVPEIFWLNLTTACDNKCLWCYGEGHKAAGEYMKLETAISILDEMKAIGSQDCILIGGEPMLHPSVFEIIERAKQNKFRVFVVTNGRIFSDIENANKIKDLDVDLVTVSLHGWSQNSYEKYAGPKGAFSQVCTAIENLKKNNVNTGVSFVLSKFIENDLETAIDLVHEFGFSFVEFNIGAPAVSSDGVNGSFTIDMKEQNKAVMRAFSLCQTKGIQAGFNLTTPHCLFTDLDLDDLFEKALISSGCTLKTGSGVVFKTNGAIASCNHFLDFEIVDEKTSNEILENGNFLNFWNSSELIEMREEANSYNSLACKECDHWGACGGGCLVSWLHHNPEQVGLKPINLKRINKRRKRYETTEVTS